MKSIIVGTAGHIDHGKTALVRALTGIDTDRLEEEKRRGITIDLGFANLDLSSPAGEPIRLGFVDVPGHERFVRNMLAGVGGIDLALLVIAADESVKPQTREHFDICRLLGIQRGITVLTKSDLVDEETLAVARSEVQEFVRGSFLEDAPVLTVSAKTGAGLDELRHELARIALEIQEKDAAGTFRLPIDRVFSMKGFGTVVTGTLVSGSVQKEDEVEVFPSGRRVRVRGIQVHGETANSASAGQRTALNLAGVEVEDLARGMTLAAPGLFRPTERVDVRIHLLPGAKPLKDRARVHLHAFTAETIAEVRLYESKQLDAGDSGFAQLRLPQPTLLFPGDRFIVRQFSPVVTIGGGTVLDVVPEPKAVFETRLGFLHTLQSGSDAEMLSARVARRAHQGIAFHDLVAETGWLPERLRIVAGELENSGQLRCHDDCLIAEPSFASACASAEQAVNAFHNRNSLAGGISRDELRSQLKTAPPIFNGILDSLVRAGKLALKGEVISIPGRGVSLKDDESGARRQIEEAFASAALRVPSLDEVLSNLKLDRARAQKIVTLLLREKTLVKIAGDLVFHRTALDDLRKLIAGQKQKSPKIDVSRFKVLTGISRKYAIPLLEYLDREHVTRRVGNERVIL